MTNENEQLLRSWEKLKEIAVKNLEEVEALRQSIDNLGPGIEVQTRTNGNTTITVAVPRPYIKAIMSQLATQLVSQMREIAEMKVSSAMLG